MISSAAGSRPGRLRGEECGPTANTPTSNTPALLRVLSTKGDPVTRTSSIWFVASTVMIVVGYALAVPFPSVGSVVAVAGIVSLTGFLLYVFRVATTHDDQWVWQTPGKPRRDLRAEQAAKRESESTGTPQDGPDST